MGVALREFPGRRPARRAGGDRGEPLRRPLAPGAGGKKIRNNEQHLASMEALVAEAIRLSREGSDMLGTRWESGIETEGLRPSNPVTGRPYWGRNAAFLTMEAIWNGYETTYYAGYRQWKDGLKAQVRKGEKGTPVSVRKTYFTCRAHTLPRRRCGECTVFDDPRSFWGEGRVFNAAQATGWEPPVMEAPPIIEQAMEWVRRVEQRSEVRIEFDLMAERGGFRPSDNKIRLPESKRFKNDRAFLQTLVHELMHASGRHPRAERNMEASRDSVLYAREEIIVETASWWFLLAHGFNPFGDRSSVCAEQATTNTLEYLSSWIGAYDRAGVNVRDEVPHIVEEAGKACSLVMEWTRDDDPVAEPIR